MGYGKIKMKKAGMKPKMDEKDKKQMTKDAGKFIKTMKYKYGNFKMTYKSGGMKPDYLDFDKDGNKEESMQSAISSKNSMGMGGKKMMKKGGKKMMMGGTKKKMGGGYRMKK
jgi:hypothetical protein